MFKASPSRVPEELVSMIEVIVRETEEVEIDGTRRLKIVAEEIVWSLQKNDELSFERVAKRVKSMVVGWAINIALAKDMGLAK